MRKRLERLVALARLQESWGRAVKEMGDRCSQLPGPVGKLGATAARQGFLKEIAAAGRLVRLEYMLKRADTATAETWTEWERRGWL